MQRFFRLLLASSLFVVASAAIRAETPAIECTGVMAIGSNTRVALVSDTGATAQWVTVGDTFAGYIIKAIDVKIGVAVLVKDGQELQIPLRASKVATGPAEAPPAIKDRILKNLLLLSAAADQYYLENGKNTATLNDLVGPNRYVKTVDSADGENYRLIKFEQGQPLKVITASGYVITHKP